MKKITMFAAIMAACLLFPVVVFANGNCELTIQNKTDATIVGVIIKESETDIVQFSDTALEKNAPAVFKVKKNTLYDIVLIDRHNNRYGKTGLSWDVKQASVSIEHTDFIHENLWDIIWAIITLPFRG
jgi:hypothetical protein